MYVNKKGAGMSESLLPFRPIGTIHSPHSGAAGTPIQPRYARDARGRVELEPSFGDAVKDLEGFERIWLIFAFHRSQGWKSLVVPFKDTVPRGLFATRAPRRPNPIGMSCVRLLKVEGTTLYVADIDILDGTPLLDIKPYVPQFDAYPDARAGWVDNAPKGGDIADKRFETD